MSILSYGGYSHDENSVRLTCFKRRILGQANQSLFLKTVYDVQGVVQGADSAELTSKLAAMQAAYDLQHQDFVLRVNGADSHHKLFAASTINGVRTHGLSFTKVDNRQWGWHTEYAYIRSFSVRVEAEQLALTDPYSGIVSWSETLSQIGTGGADFVILESINGPPVVQTTCPQTSFAAIQKGYAVGAASWPFAPAALFPGNIKPKLTKFSRSTPKQFGLNQNTLFPISWEYVYEAGSALSGFPGIPL